MANLRPSYALVIGVSCHGAILFVLSTGLMQVFLEVKQYWPAVQSATSATVQVFRLSLCHIHSDIHLNPIKIR